MKRYFLVIIITAFFAMPVNAEILDLSDGRYWSWNTQTGDMNDWLLVLAGGSTATIEGGGLRLVDPGDEAQAQAAGLYGMPLGVTRYVMQWDQKVISDGTPGWFIVQDRVWDGPWTQRINTRIDQTVDYARVTDALGNSYSPSASGLSHITHGEWYRFIVVRTDNHYAITVQRLSDGHIELDGVVRPVNNPAVEPDSINFSTGHVTFADSVEVYINNVKIGKRLDAPGSCQEAIEQGYRLPGDLNGDCRVDLEDFSLLALEWLACNDPDDETCVGNW